MTTYWHARTHMHALHNASSRPHGPALEPLALLTPARFNPPKNPNLKPLRKWQKEL